MFIFFLILKPYRNKNKKQTNKTYEIDFSKSRVAILILYGSHHGCSAQLFVQLWVREWCYRKRWSHDKKKAKANVFIFQIIMTPFSRI